MRELVEGTGEDEVVILCFPNDLTVFNIEPMKQVGLYKIGFALFFRSQAFLLVQFLDELLDFLDAFARLWPCDGYAFFLKMGVNGNCYFHTNPF